MAQLNVLAVIHYPIFGGPHNQVLRLARPLRHEGWNTITVLPDESESAAQRLRSEGIEVSVLSLHRVRASLDPNVHSAFIRGFRSEVMALRRLIRDRDVRLVQLMGLVNPHAALAARLEGRAVLWQILDTRAPLPIRTALMPLVIWLSDAAMCTGETVARAHPGSRWLGKRLHYYFPPVDCSEFRPDPVRREIVRRELGIREGEIVIGAVAKLTRQKGLEHMIRAAAGIKASGRNVALRILGSSMTTQEDLRYEASLRQQVGASGLSHEGAKIFVDPHGRVAELMTAFDVFMLTSPPRSEGIPTTILEAMACGVAVVATDVGSVSEVVEEGKTGFVVPPLNPQALAGKVTRLIDDPQLCRQLGEGGRQRAVERYDLSACVRAHTHAYLSAVERHEARLAR